MIIYTEEKRIKKQNKKKEKFAFGVDLYYLF